MADIDPWLDPYRDKLEMQQAYLRQYERRMLGTTSVEEYALGHLYFGLHSGGVEDGGKNGNSGGGSADKSSSDGNNNNGWVLREWAPNATRIFLVGEPTEWHDNPAFEFKKIDNKAGVWELRLPAAALSHKTLYKLHVYWNGGDGLRLPAYTTLTYQDPKTHDFSAMVWNPPKPYQWKWTHCAPETAPTRSDATALPLIYEAHIGMSSEKGEVASYDHFRKNILPRIATLGYNTVQLMAIQEHPYYGSFGYHVSNFYAASSRFGTPDELKALIDEAHHLGLRVTLDIVHSHAVKNEAEGLSRFDGTLYQYFHDGPRGMHTAWDSRVFDYDKPDVVHYLLSNIRFWLDEYHFDGFRFDGVTSMIYRDHGLERAFGSYDDYVGDNIDLDALGYLRLANKLAHAVNKNTLTIAEDTSAYPGLAAPIKAGGIGFDYRLSMGVPDLWIKTLKERKDDDWDLGQLFYELTAHRVEERTISYAESHDQALVGDKTLIFRLIDKEMYYHMSIDDDNIVVNRGMALHKLIRLLTASTNGGGYLTFMGNEFGHPEWIDFPREGNNWSYHYARRQWSLADDPNLKYQFLQNFDTALVKLLKNEGHDAFDYVTIDQNRKLLSYRRGRYVFVFNFSPITSYINHEIPAPNGDYQLILSSDDAIYGGQNRIDTTLEYHSIDERLKVYIPSRVALVFQKKATDE